jgi:hypothetical protein
MLSYELGDIVHGVYIYGSVALGHFNKEKSDIDFMTFLKRDITEVELKTIKSIHEKLNSVSVYADRLEGEYINFQDIQNRNYSKEYPYFAFGRYHGVVGIKSFSLFQVKEKGLKIYGEDFNTIIDEINWHDIKNDLAKRLNEYWIKKGKNPLLLMFDGWVSLIVLTLCRIYYVLERESIASKMESAEFIMKSIDEKYLLLIREALRIQYNTSKKSLFNTKTERKKVARQFVNYIVTTCNERFQLV